MLLGGAPKRGGSEKIVKCSVRCLLTERGTLRNAALSCDRFSLAIAPSHQHIDAYYQFVYLYRSVILLSISVLYNALGHSRISSDLLYN